MKTTEQMIEVMTALKDGEDIEFRNANTDEEWNACTKPIWNWEWFDYRIKPKLKPVDLSVLIDSGIDCEDEHGYIRNDYKTAEQLRTFKIKPRLDYWFCFDNFSDPCTLIDDLHDAGFDIVNSDCGFAVEGLQEGYCWPWEVSDGSKP